MSQFRRHPMRTYAAYITADRQAGQFPMFRYRWDRIVRQRCLLDFEQEWKERRSYARRLLQSVGLQKSPELRLDRLRAAFEGKEIGRDRGEAAKPREGETGWCMRRRRDEEDGEDDGGES